MPADPELTPAGVALLDLLQRVSNSDAFIFGHHNTDLEGQHFNDHYHLDGRGAGVAPNSDVQEATGHMPAMTGFNLDWVARQVKLSTKAWQEAVQPMLEKGIVLQLFWEASNPVTQGNAHDLSGNPITAILPGGRANELWTQWMDRIVDFLHAVGLSTSHAAIFRPFHEATGDWFWWGTKASTPGQYQAAWKYTVGYLRGKERIPCCMHTRHQSQRSTGKSRSAITRWRRATPAMTKLTLHVSTGMARGTFHEILWVIAHACPILPHLTASCSRSARSA